MKNERENLFKRIISDNWEKFKEKYPNFNHKQYDDAIQKMLNCGTEFMGYGEYICKNCKTTKQICFSCKSSFCLSCSKVYVDNFVNKVSEKLHPGIVYRHVVLTMPEKLRIVFYKERKVGNILSHFMRTGYKCLEETISELKKKKLKIGAIIVVQTFGRSGGYNPHLHVIITDGGVCEEEETWVDLDYFSYKVLHKNWQDYLLNMISDMIDTQEMKDLVNELTVEYDKGFVVNVQKGELPEKCKSLANYLIKYVVSPPISVKRIVDYNGERVRYWYNDHKTKAKKFDDVDVFTFIGRMVQHIMPKGFQRVRYYGLQATKCFKKWIEKIKEGLKKIGRIIKGVYQVVGKKDYRERYHDVTSKDPMICECCGNEYSLWRMWIPGFGYKNYIENPLN